MPAARSGGVPHRQSPIDYVRVSSWGSIRSLVNAAQANRPGRGWWRNLLDLYGAADILVAEGAASAPLSRRSSQSALHARHGPDNQIVGGFTLTGLRIAMASRQMMAQGAQRMDRCSPKRSPQAGCPAIRRSTEAAAALPEPPVERRARMAGTSNAFQVHVTGPT